MRKYIASEAKYIISESSQHEMKLLQMGAKVEKINSKMFYVSFVINDIKIAYIYNINKKGKYFLERTKPYPMITKVFDSEEDVINIIELDMIQFKNAANSSNIHHFIDINNRLSQTIREFEDLYLYYNLPSCEVKYLLDKVSNIHDDIIKIKEKSERIFFDKDPENL